MRVAVTGTPGTGKTTAVEHLDTGLDTLHLNDVIKDDGFSTGIDEDRGSLVADLEGLSEWLDGRDDVLFESHLAHHFDADRVIVLRAHPETIVERLRERGDDDSKAYENAESEALDVILGEAVEEHGMDSVYEIETTDRDPDEVAQEIQAVVAGEREPSAGTVSYIDWL
ncbi:adenylate kinase family protein [Haloarcula sp. NS06]|uniref:adenylate kinase family protein n=1 Tax=unclassified Haloarcula TaxID=2624677 RepID=UPI0027AEFB40|nr:adenylate kinase family protein [Haloarcula sp. H-GB4]MDQ2071770.1 adenylate kinase family protein [Haloarcula sp. H-GB4]